jgi:hypothetical protein
MLDLYPAVSRSHALIHISKDKKGNSRSFRVFNYAKKAKLYDIGLKKGWGYKIYTNFKGRFSGKFPGGEIYYENYLKVKQEALMATTNTIKTVDPDAGINKFELRARDNIMNIAFAVQKENNFTDKETAAWLTAHGMPIDDGMLTYWRGKVAKSSKN